MISAIILALSLDICFETLEVVEGVCLWSILRSHIFVGNEIIRIDLPSVAKGSMGT